MDLASSASKPVGVPICASPESGYADTKHVTGHGNTISKNQSVRLHESSISKQNA